MPVTKNQIKLVRSLAQRRERNATGLFVAEGDKLVPDLFSAFSCRLLLATSDFLQQHPGLQADEVVETTHADIERASLLNAPQQVIALFRLPAADCNLDAITSQLTLVLDRVQDPGNLGTIVRIADWFGIRNIVCSCDTVDVFNPKTVQATMGALARVRVTYTDLVPFLKSLPDGFPVYGTFLEGDNIYQLDLPQKAIIVMGNEGNGISEEVERLVNSKLFIPSFPPNEPTSESLNVAVATAITCAEFRRRNF
ncbi:MAG: RNA methyltransferase [Paludibacteraceae bacterium]|nr:RNA methyltransferase [Paludibacteraceae bacterium]